MFQKDATGGFTVYVPSFSKLSGAKAQGFVEENIEIINNEIFALGIKINQWTLFDSSTKLVVRPEDFIDYVPYINLERSIFCIVNEDGSLEPNTVRYIDSVDRTNILIFTSVLMAKKELMYPEKSTSWSVPGKQLLMYLVSKKFKLPQDFGSYGPWKSVDIDGFTNTSPRRTLDIKKMKIDAAVATGIRIQEKLLNLFEEEDKKEKEDSTEGDWKNTGTTAIVPVKKDGESTRLSLTRLMEIGVDTILKSNKDSCLEIDIDTMAQFYKAIYVDCMSGLCYIELHTAAGITVDEIKEDFQSENIQILEDRSQL